MTSYGSLSAFAVSLVLFAEADCPVDDATSFYLDQQDALCSSLYVVPNKPKGITYGRKRERHSRDRR